MLSQVLGGARGGLFSTGDAGLPSAGRNLFQADSTAFPSPMATVAVDGPIQHTEPPRKPSVSQQAAQNRAAQNAATKKVSTASGIS